jgi:hypothetical protein
MKAAKDSGASIGPNESNAVIVAKLLNLHDRMVALMTGALVAFAFAVAILFSF